MKKLIIEGGCRLRGSVKISGSKNSVLPILFATLLTDKKCVIENVPELKDVETAISILKYFRKSVQKKIGKVIVENTTSDNISTTTPYELMRKMRASFLVAGPLLARYKKAKVVLPGGCAIGVRPVNIHLDGFRSLGTKVHLEEGYVHISAKKLRGTTITLPFQSVGATENLVMASVLASGKTIIRNAASEPEIVDLINFLNQLGVSVRYTDNKTIEIVGVESLKGIDKYSVIPDRIEAGTYLIATAATGGNVRIENCIPEHLQIVTSKLRQASARISISSNSIELKVTKKLTPVSIITKPYPGFATDLQAQWMALMCTANGCSTIRETVFENRFLHVAELQRLGAKLKIKDDTVFVQGNSKLTGAPVMVSDLRAGAALVLAGLLAKGKTTISHIYHLERGYENLVDKLKNLGAKLDLIDE